MLHYIRTSTGLHEAYTHDVDLRRSMSGFYLIYMIMTDINECLENNGLCEGECHNTEGSYECSCPDGKRLTANGRTCQGRPYIHLAQQTLSYDYFHL